MILLFFYIYIYIYMILLQTVPVFIHEFALISFLLNKIPQASIWGKGEACSAAIYTTAKSPYSCFTVISNHVWQTWRLCAACSHVRTARLLLLMRSSSCHRSSCIIGSNGYFQRERFQIPRKLPHVHVHVHQPLVPSSKSPTAYLITFSISNPNDWWPAGLKWTTVI